MSNTIKCESCGNYIDEHMKDNCPSCNKTDKSKDELKTPEEKCTCKGWFECPVCKAKKNKKYHSTNNGEHQKVKVIDFDMEFGSMVWFMIKWAIASIPAFMILFILTTLLASILGVSMVSLFTI